MNQQQRAGKHPSFSRDRKPPGMRRETFLKRPEALKLKERKRKVEKNATKASSASNKHFVNLRLLPDYILRKICHIYRDSSGFLRKDFKHILDVLDRCEDFGMLGVIYITPLCREIIDTYLAVCNDSWKKTFHADLSIKAREFILHVAVENALMTKNFHVINRLLPQIRDRKLVMCMVSTAASELTDSQSLHFIKTVYRMKENSTELCLKEALSLQQWPLLSKLFKVWQPPRRATEAVAYAAITQGQWELVEDCLKRGVGKECKNRILVAAIKSRRLDTMLACVTMGVTIAEACAKTGLDLNDIETSGRTVLHNATEERGSVQIVEPLHQAGANSNVSDTLGEIALHAAIGRNDSSLLKLPVTNSQGTLDLSDREGRSRSILHEAVVWGRSVKIVELLLLAGADPDVMDRRGETAFHAAVERKNWSLLRLLLGHSQAAGRIASTRLAHTQGRTLLHDLCEEGKADIVHTLLLMKADPLVRDNRGNTLMMAASEATEGRENMYRALIQSGISTHQAVVSESLLASLKERNAGVDEEFSSPMRRAVEKGQFRIAKMLYASGVCSNREIYELSTFPTTRACLEKSKLSEMLKFLDDISSQPHSLRDLCSLKVSHLIGCGAGRDDRVVRAGLPPPVRRQVLLEHVTDPEFLKDCPPDPQGNPPFQGRFRFLSNSLILRHYLFTDQSCFFSRSEITPAFRRSRFVLNSVLRYGDTEQRRLLLDLFSPCERIQTYQPVLTCACRIEDYECGAAL